MTFNLNEFLLAISFALDFIEMDLLGVPTNHGKRVAYISLRLAKKLGLSKKQIYDVVSLSILHDNGVGEIFSKGKVTNDSRGALILNEGVKAHCIIGEDNIKEYPFFTDSTNVIKYHHERYDGTGFFGIKGEAIPLMSQIIFLADRVEHEFVNTGVTYNIKKYILEYVKAEEGKGFSTRLVKLFLELCDEAEFWECLNDRNIFNSLERETPIFTMDLSFVQVRSVTKVLSKIIDSKSKFTLVHSDGLAEKVDIMTDYYKIRGDEKQKLIIAADLHDIGKLAISNAILDKTDKLSEEEFSCIKQHTKYTRMALQQISGFEDITEWAANHHEKLDGSGYPMGKTDKELDFNSRLMACLDIYQALIEERPYRISLTHENAIKILKDMQEYNLIDRNIVNDIDIVFRMSQV